MKTTFQKEIDPKQIIYFEGEPVAIKADCKDGVFLRGRDKGVEKGSKTLKMQVVRVNAIPQASLFMQKEPCDWLQVFFIDEDGMLCSVLLKKESMGNFIATCRDIVGKERKSFTAVTLIGEMSARTNDKGKFFAIEFSYEEMADEDFERNKSFFTEQSERIYDARILLEYADKNIKPKTEWVDGEHVEISQKAMAAFGYALAIAEKAEES